MNTDPAISAALQQVSAKYVLGAIQYYAGQTPDPWQQNLDRFETAIIRGDNPKPAVSAFVTESSRLLREFQTALALGDVKT